MWAIRITPLCVGRRYDAAAAGDRGERDVVDLDGLLEQSVEEQAAVVGAATVEAEGVLVEVVVELLRADGALMGAEQPTLQERGDPRSTRGIATWAASPLA